MKQYIQVQERNGRSPGQGASAAKLALVLVPLSVLVSACGHDDGFGGGGFAPQGPLLQVGQQRIYNGTTTRAVVYATPTATQQDNTLVYNFTENLAVEQAPTGAPADFDVHAVYAYSTVQDPGTGSVPLAQTVDTYDSLTTTVNSQQVVTFGQTVVAISNDETSNALGDGPYTETQTTTAIYPTPRENFAYPLQTGASMTVPQSENASIAFTDLNASGAAPSNGTRVGYTLVRTQANDGSYSYQQANVTGTSLARTQNPDGSGTETYTGASSSTDWTLGVPVSAAGISTIPITETVNGSTTTTTNYSAQDWYPGGGAPASPLVLATRNVVGPVTNLPSACGNPVQEPGIYEIDTTTNNLSPWGPTYTTTTTRNFSGANGASVCQLTTSVELTYALDTGDLMSTTTTTTSQYLTAINY